MVKREANSPFMILIGNKADLTGKRSISEEDGKKLALEHSLMFSETSAKTGNNIRKVFERAATHLVVSENDYRDAVMENVNLSEESAEGNDGIGTNCSC